MTAIEKPCKRRTLGTLGPNHGPDSGKRLVVTLERGDVLALKPERASAGRTEFISLFDVYEIAIRHRVRNENLEKARAVKRKKKR